MFIAGKGTTRRQYMAQSTKETAPKRAITERQLQQIRQIAETIQYGTITLVFQDGVLVQIDRNEKFRIR